jgi:hypothetical protein
MLALLLLGCGGGSPAPAPSPPTETATSEAAVRGFLHAVADSNIDGMAHFWGTASGPAAVTGQPSDYIRRLVVTQVYLHGAPFKVVRTDPVPNDPNHEVVMVELDRRQCVRSVPFTTVKTSGQAWLVTAVDLNLAGTPGRPCFTPPPAKPGT